MLKESFTYNLIHVLAIAFGKKPQSLGSTHGSTHKALPGGIFAQEAYYAIDVRGYRLYTLLIAELIHYS